MLNYDSEPKHIYNAKTARKIGCGLVLALFVLVGLLTFFSGGSNGGASPLPFAQPKTDANFIRVSAGETPAAQVGSLYKVTLLVHNPTEASQTVGNLTVSNTYLGEANFVDSVSPEPKRSQVVEEGLAFLTLGSVPAFDTARYDVAFLPKEAGVFSGEITVCFSSGYCDAVTITTTVRE